ncbi:acyltransferase family protein [Clostridium sp.]|uniref:acyltransferase family protein n=1 Tax=Clostridium sp. TaxID=1506 RepID=UPI003F2CD8E2
MRDSRIEKLRVFSMVLILLAHYIRNFESISFISQILVVGVYIFIIISAYLNSRIDIKDNLKWIKGRFISLMIPYYIFLVIYFTISAINNLELSFKKISIYFLNLQGFTNRIEGTGHLWFLTVIFICYLVTLILDKKKEFLNDNLMGIIGILAVVQTVISLQDKILGEYAFYVFLYIAIYSISIEKIGKLQRLKVRNILFISWLCILLRLAGKVFLDNTIIYERIIVFYTSAGLGLGIFSIFTNKNLRIFRKESKVITFLDNISYPVYLTHYIFLNGVFNVIGIVKSNLLSVSIGLALILTLSILINNISKNILSLRWCNR